MGLIGPIGRKGLLGSVIWDLEVLTSWWALKKLSAESRELRYLLEMFMCYYLLRA